MVRIPSTLIWPPAGVSNSMVPRLLAVTGYWSESTKAMWPLPASEIVVPARPICVPVSSRMTIPILAACAETFSTATPKTTPSVLSKASR